MATTTELGTEQPKLARLESVRGVAALAVVIAHCYGIPRHLRPSSALPGRIVGSGFWTAFIFFCLTGYLMSRPLLAAAYSGRKTDYKRYFLNRALRVLPLYYFMMALVLIVQQGGGSLHNWVKFTLFLENYGHLSAEVVNGPMWSLVVEVQFYVLLPPFIWLLSKVARDLRVAGLLLLAFSAATFWLQEVYPVHTLNDSRSLPVEIFWFTPGLLLAWLHVSKPTWLKGLLGRSDVWALAAVLVWSVAIHRNSSDLLVAVASFLLLGGCVLPLAGGVTRRALDLPAVAFFGPLSYGIYLWHIPVLVELQKHGIDTYWPLVGTVLPISLALAMLTYRYVETPFLKLRKRWTA